MDMNVLNDGVVQVVARARRQLINQVAHRRAAKHYQDEREALETEFESAEQYGQGPLLLKKWLGELSSR